MSRPVTLGLTRKEQYMALRAQGVPEDKAWRAAGLPGTHESSDANYAQVVGPELRFPIRLTLPWSHLCSDNGKYGVAVRNGKGRLIHTATYRAARAATQKKAREAMSVGSTRLDALAVPLRLNARVYLPDDRMHDVANLAKCCHDALEKIVVTNDRWLYCVTWERAGIDVDAPRAEIEISPL